MKTALALIAFIFMFGIPPAAAGPLGNVVSYADLDLATADGVARLDRRIAAAVATACGTASGVDLAGQNDVRRCRLETSAAARRSLPVVVVTLGE